MLVIKPDLKSTPIDWSQTNKVLLNKISLWNLFPFTKEQQLFKILCNNNSLAQFL